MPILHLQSKGHNRAPDGTITPLPSAVVLAARGPCVQVTLGISKSFAQQLQQQGQSLPQPVSGLALIDTGAISTCIDAGIASRIGLPVIDVVNMASASHASTQQNIHPVQIEVVGLPISIDAPRSMGVLLANQGLIALLGRDVLQQCTLFYNGLTGQITLSI